MLELSDYDENEDAHKSSNVECVEVNNGIKMANKRSKSLEKEEVDDVKRTESSDLLKRPDTAPPLLPDAIKQATAATMLSKEVAESFCEVRPTQQQQHFDCAKTELMINDSKEAKSISPLLADSNEPKGATWHEHVYRKPPKMPTPFSIVDILWGGGDNRKLDADHRHHHHISDSNNNSSRAFQSNVEPSTLQQLLNFNIKTPSPSRYENSHHHQNGINSRGMSLSETSEDESVDNDQPLNLCVAKSRDSSPGLDRLSGKTKKGAILCFIFSFNLNLNLKSLESDEYVSDKRERRDGGIS